MGPRALGDYRPSPRGAWPYGASIENRLKWGSRGLAPACCIPLWGREGVTLTNPLMAVWKGFLQRSYFLSACRIPMTPRMSWQGLLSIEKS